MAKRELCLQLSSEWYEFYDMNVMIAIIFKNIIFYLKIFFYKLITLKNIF